MIANSELDLSSFYITGGTLPPDAPSYVERQADRALFDALSRGEFCYVLDTRQMGKSSLMIRIGRKLNEQGAAIAVLDLTAIGQNLTPDRWYAGLLQRLGEQIGEEDALVDYWRGHKDVGPMQRFLGAVRLALTMLEERQAARRTPITLVLFLDEIDAVRSLPFPADELFAGIRECYNRRTLDPLFRRLVICLLGVATPADLIQDTRMSPFNIGQRILLTDFTPSEAAPLAQGLRGGETRHGDGGTGRRGDTDAGRLLNRVLYWTGGHPYMTQRLCHLLAQKTASDPDRPLTIRQVDEACEQLFLTRQARDIDDNLAFVRNRLLRSEVDLADLLEMYRQVRAGRHVPDDETNPLCSVLRLAGIVRAQQGELRVRNRIYDRVFDPQWVQSHMPGAEIRRQRAAYRRGALRATGVAACVVAAFVALSVVAFSEARRANGLKNQADAAAARARNALNTLLATSKERDQAVIVANASARQADKAAGKARQAEATALHAQHQADLGRREAEWQGSKALAATREVEREKRQLQEAASRTFTADAQTRMDEGDAMGAARPLLAAMRMDAGDPERRAMQARRLGMALNSMPRLTRLFACEGPIVWAAFSKDEGYVAAAAGHSVRMWDVATERSLGVLPHAADVTDAAFSPEGERLAVACQDGQVYLWSVLRQGAAHRLLWRGRCPARANRVVWSPNGELLAAGHASSDTEPSTVSTWDAGTGRLRYRVPMPYSCSDLAFSANSRRLVVGAASYAAKILDAQTGAALLGVGHSLGQAVPSLSFSPSGDRFVMVAGYIDYGILSGFSARVIDLATGDPVTPPLKCNGPCGFSPDGTRLALANGVDAQIVDARTGSTLIARMHHDADIGAISFSPDGAYVLTASSDGAARIWDAGSGTLAMPPLRQAGAIQTARFDRSGWRVLTAGSDGALRIWDLSPAFASRALATLPADTGYELPINRFLRRFGRLAAIDIHTGRCALWDLDAGRLMAIPSPGVRWMCADADAHASHMVLCGVDPGGAVVAQGYDLRTGRPLSGLHSLPGSVVPHRSWRYPVLSTDGRRCVFNSETGQITILDLMTGATVRRFGLPFNGWQVAADGSQLLLSSPHGMRMADSGTGRWLTPPVPLPARGALALSPHGARAAIITPDGGLEVCDTATGQVQLNLPHASETPLSKTVTFSEDERLMVAISETDWLLADLAHGRVIIHESLPLRAHSSMAQFRADGRRLVVAAAGEAVLINTETGGILCRLGHTSVPSAFSPDGRYVAWATENHVEIINAGSGQVCRDLVHPGSVSWGGSAPDPPVWFSSDSRLILTNCADGYARLWDVETGERVGQRITEPDSNAGVCFAGPNRILAETSPGSHQSARLIALPQPVAAEQDVATLASLTGEEPGQAGSIRLADAWGNVRRRQPRWFAVSGRERHMAAANAEDAEHTRRRAEESEEMRVLEGAAASPPAADARFWRELAMDCMRVGWWRPALDALDELKTLEPEREDTLFATAHVAAAAHLYDTAAAAYAKLAALHPPPDPYALGAVKEQSQFSYLANRWPDVVSAYFPLIEANQAPPDLSRISALALQTGHKEAYAALCRRVAAIRDLGEAAFSVCSLAPGALQDYTRIAARAERAFTGSRDVENVGVLAMLHCRAGEYRKALSDADAAARLPQSGDRTAQLARAIALQHLGRTDEARALLVSLNQAYIADGDNRPVGEKDATDRVSARLRYREVHALLETLK